MAWKGKAQPAALRRGGSVWKAVVLRAGGQCQATYSDTGGRCVEGGTDLDHITPGFNHDPDNLQWLCAYHHKVKTAREARAARERVAAVDAMLDAKRSGVSGLAQFSGGEGLRLL